MREGGGKHKLHPLSVKLFRMKQSASAGKAHVFDVAKNGSTLQFFSSGELMCRKRKRLCKRSCRLFPKFPCLTLN